MALDPLGWAQRKLGGLLRTKVAGTDAPKRARDIWLKPGERWFGPDDPISRVNEDASMFAGGIAALLLQSLHPLAMAGVAGHSGYKGDPWGRLQRTSNYIAVTTYGTVEDAEATIATIRAIHERVRGKDHRGRPYRASDPHLLTWVHVAEIRSFLAAHQRFGKRPLDAAEADRYVAQAGLAAGKLGVPEPPTSVAEMEACLESYRPELERTPAAVEAADFLLRTPPLPWFAKPGYAMLAAGGLHTMPTWAREMLGLRLADALAPMGGPLGSLGTVTVRWALGGDLSADEDTHFA